MSLLEDIVSGDGLSSLHGIIWVGLGVWALIGTFFYIPAKRKQDKITVSPPRIDASTSVLIDTALPPACAFNYFFYF